MGFGRLIGRPHVFIHDSEVQDAIDAINKNGYKDDDFTVGLAEDKFIPPLPPGPEDGSITVIYNPSGKQRVYNSGPANAWTGEFIRDLESGAFN